MTEGLATGQHRRTRGASRGVTLRRRRVMLEIGVAIAWCFLGYRLLISPMRRFEVVLTTGVLHLLGQRRISDALGDAFLIYGPAGPPIVARLTPSCSSLTSLLALSSLAVVALRQRPQAVLGLLAGGSWVLLANQLRLVLSVLAGRYVGMGSMVLFHDWAGSILTFINTLGGLLVMISLTMHQPERAEQDRAGRHTARRPDSWARPGLGYRAELTGRPRAPRIRVVALVHRYLLPKRVSRALGARRERHRVDYRIGHLDPEGRITTVRKLAGRGLGVHTATLVAVATHETDAAVLDALAEAVAARQWEPASDQQILALRLWARAWLMRSPAGRPPSGKLIAVTGAGGPAGVAVIRALRVAGHRVLGLDANPHAVGLGLADLSAVLAPAGTDGYEEPLIQAIEEHRPEALICTVAEEYAALAPLVPRLAELGCNTWLPDLAAAETCLDKAAFAAALHAAEVPHPATADNREAAAALPGPWIVKPARGRGSRDVVAADTAEDLDRAFAVVPEPIAQTRLSGREFTADALVDRGGALVTCVPRWRDETKAGISVRGTTFDSSAVTRVVAAALSAVGLTGPANVQGFVAEPDALADDPDADVTVTVVEINPRFSGGLPLTLAAGANVVEAYLAGILDPETPLSRLTFRPGVRMTRYFTELYRDADGRPVPDPLDATAAAA